jgi:hypothetical protein
MLTNVGGGGAPAAAGGAAPAAAAGGEAAAEAPKEEAKAEEKEESDDDMVSASLLCTNTVAKTFTGIRSLRLNVGLECQGERSLGGSGLCIHIKMHCCGSLQTSHPFVSSGHHCIARSLSHFLATALLYLPSP